MTPMAANYQTNLLRSLLLQWAVVVAQLVERSLPIPDVRGSNPVISKNLFIHWTLVYCQLCIEKTKIKEKRPGMAHFLKKQKIKKGLFLVTYMPFLHYCFQNRQHQIWWPIGPCWPGEKWLILIREMKYRVWIIKHFYPFKKTQNPFASKNC